MWFFIVALSVWIVGVPCGYIKPSASDEEYIVTKRRNRP